MELNNPLSLYTETLSEFGKAYQALNINPDGGGSYCKGFEKNIGYEGELSNSVSCSLYEPGTFSNILSSDSLPNIVELVKANGASGTSMYNGQLHDTKYGGEISINMPNISTIPDFEGVISKSQNFNVRFDRLDNIGTNSLFSKDFLLSTINLYNGMSASPSFNPFTDTDLPVDTHSTQVIDLIKASFTYQLGSYNLPRSMFDKSFNIRFGDFSKLCDYYPTNTRLFEIFRPSEIDYRSNKRAFFAWDAHLPAGKKKHDYYHNNQNKMGHFDVPHNHTKLNTKDIPKALVLQFSKFGTRAVGGIGIFIDAKKIIESEEKLKESGGITAQWISGSLGARAGAKLGVLLIPILGPVAVPILAIGGSIIAASSVPYLKDVIESFKAFLSQSTSKNNSDTKIAAQSLDAFTNQSTSKNNSDTK